MLLNEVELKKWLISKLEISWNKTWMATDLLTFSGHFKIIIRTIVLVLKPISPNIFIQNY